MGSKAQFKTDIIPTSVGDLEITFLGHGSLMFAWGWCILHVDPYTMSIAIIWILKH